MGISLTVPNLSIFQINFNFVNLKCQLVEINNLNIFKPRGASNLTIVNSQIDTHYYTYLHKNCFAFTGYHLRLTDYKFVTVHQKLTTSQQNLPSPQKHPKRAVDFSISHARRFTDLFIKQYPSYV